MESKKYMVRFPFSETDVSWMLSYMDAIRVNLEQDNGVKLKYSHTVYDYAPSHTSCTIQFFYKPYNV